LGPAWAAGCEAPANDNSGDLLSELLMMMAAEL
jgi:hypothetical protein